MTYKNREVQPELFCGIKKKQKIGIFSKKIFEDHYKASISFSCDTLIVIVIALLMINLTSFVLGIERGKLLAKAVPDEAASQKANKPLVKEKPVSELALPAIATENQEKDSEVTKVKEEITPEPEPATNGYIIQLVTYTSTKYADREVANLRERGYEGNVLKSGDYFVVYAGIYDCKSTAKEKLTRFKERYKDCFVRFLKNT